MNEPRVEKLVERDNRVTNAEPASSQSAPRATRSLKVALGGDAGVGKTSLMEYLRTGKFTITRAMTIGVEFHTLQVSKEKGGYKLVVWDLAGQERFALTRPGFYRGSLLVVLVFDVSNPNTFYNLPRWCREVRQYLPSAPMVLLGNKIDLPRRITSEEGRSLAEAWGIPYFETSCQSGEQVGQFFAQLSDYAIQSLATNDPAK